MKVSILKLKFFIVLIFISLLSSCSWDVLGLSAINTIEQKAQTTVKKLSPKFNNQYRRSYVSSSTKKNAILGNTIQHLLVKNIKLKDALKAILPNAYILAEDLKVDLTTTVNIDVNNITYKEYFEILSSQTNYRIELQNDNKIVVSSADYKRWNVAALVAMPKFTSNVGDNVKAGDTSNTTSLEFEKKDDTWQSLLDGLRSILGSTGTVVDNRRLGEIYALGEPQKLLAADKWMKRIITSSQKQILLDVAILEVTVNDAAANGIDWNAIYDKGGVSEIGITNAAGQTLTGGGAWSIVGKYVNGKVNLEAAISFLRKRGKVNVQHHPSLTVTNGSTAYLGSSEQFSYIAAIKTETTVADGIVVKTITPSVKTINIGVNIAMTARLLENNEILVEVIPVISSLQSIETLFTDKDGNIIKAPRIALQELSTQIITKSGQPIHLGGLITEKIVESASNIPGPLGSIFGLLFKSEKKKFEKKETLLIITPTEI